MESGSPDPLPSLPPPNPHPVGTCGRGATQRPRTQSPTRIDPPGPRAHSGFVRNRRKRPRGAMTDSPRNGSLTWTPSISLGLYTLVSPITRPLGCPVALSEPSLLSRRRVPALGGLGPCRVRGQEAARTHVAQGLSWGDRDSPGAQRCARPGLLPHLQPSGTLHPGRTAIHLVRSSPRVLPATRRGSRECAPFALRRTPWSPPGPRGGGSGAAQPSPGEGPAAIPARPLGSMGCWPAGRPWPSSSRIRSL